MFTILLVTSKPVSPIFTGQRSRSQLHAHRLETIGPQIHPVALFFRQCDFEGSAVFGNRLLIGKTHQRKTFKENTNKIPMSSNPL